MHIHSDVPAIGLINLTEDHSFSCDVDYDSKDQKVNDIQEQKINYYIQFSESRSGNTPGTSILNEHKNAIKVPKAEFEPEKLYLFNCTAEFEIDGQKHAGSTLKAFSTNVINEGLFFSIEPKEGIPFDTPFVLKVKKPDTGRSDDLKCEFGYINKDGKVTIPTVDTGDFLKQSKRENSA